MFSCSSCKLEYQSSQLYLAAYMALTMEALPIPGVPGFMIFCLRLVMSCCPLLRPELSLFCPSAISEFVLSLMCLSLFP